MHACMQHSTLGWLLFLEGLINVLTAVVLSNSLSIFFLQVDKILKVIPRDRKTFLFSATMTKQVRGEYSPLILLSSGCTVD